MNDLTPPIGESAIADLPGLDASEDALFAEIRRVGRAGEVARNWLVRIREELAEGHFAGASGLEIVHLYTACMDRMLRALFRWAEHEHGRRFARLNQKIAIVARGGYGRGELNPQSDIDLLFLHDYKIGPYVEVVTETILHALWDAGLTIGQVVRSVRESVRAAADDLKEKTAILDIRFLAGDEKLFASLEAALIDEALNRNQQKFFTAKLEESRERHARYGDSIYLLEPQIKEGEGGLRDLHTALWLAKVKYKVNSLRALVQKAIISQAELDEVEKAQDFLMRVRNSLHFLSGRHFDQLTFEYQERIAPLMGFGEQGPEAAGALMRNYYQQAAAISHFSEGLIARVTEDPSTGRFLRRTGARKIRPGVIIQGPLLAIQEKDFFREAPINLITVFADCQAHGVELSGSAFQHVRDNLGLIDDAFRADRRSGMALMGILSGRQRIAETLEAMHRAGVLGALIPEFGNLYARVLHDLYHIYTVDRHSLVAVRELERLRAGDFKEPNPLLTEVAREITSMPLIFLALLLHDIGKGHGHDHHERGAVLTAEVSRRLGLDSEEVDLIVFLVRNHLMMSQVAQKGDIEDQRTVEQFAHQVGSIDRLKALYLLTFADMRAVSPKVYSNWRDMLLSELYMRSLKLLEQGDREAVDPERRLALVKAALRERLAQTTAAPAEIDAFIEQMPDPYFLTVAENDVAVHFDLMRRFRDQALVCRHRHFPDLEFSEFIVVTHDQPGLFSKIAGVLTANNLNILSARITTRADKVVLDIFRVSHLMGAGALAMDEDRWLRVEHGLEQVLSGERDIEQLVAESHRTRIGSRRFVRRLATEVTIDNRSSENLTVIDVFTQDRVGLLFAITYTLFQFGMKIHLARISTNADQALDVFYVSDSAGEKLTDVETMRRLREALVERLDQVPARSAES